MGFGALRGLALVEGPLPGELLTHLLVKVRARVGVRVRVRVGIRVGVGVRLGFGVRIRVRVLSANLFIT